MRTKRHFIELGMLLILFAAIVFSVQKSRAQMSLPGWSPCATSVAQTNSTPPSSIPFVTSGAGSTLRNNFGSDVGGSFVFLTNSTITDLGRWVVSGNSQSHTLYLVSSSCVVLQSVSVNTSGATSGQYLYGSISPTSIGAGTNFYVLSQEFNAGDQWYDFFVVTTISTGSCIGPVYTDADPPNANCHASGGNETYVPVNFKITTP